MTSTEFHEQSHCRRSTWTTINPEQYIVFARIISALEEIEEQMSSANINVSCIRAALSLF